MLAASQDNAMIANELERYIGEGIINIGTSSALEWWTNTPQRTQFPTLSCMAINILSIPATSSKVEQVFSAVKITIGDKCYSLAAL